MGAIADFLGGKLIPQISVNGETAKVVAIDFQPARGIALIRTQTVGGTTMDHVVTLNKLKG